MANTTFVEDDYKDDSSCDGGGGITNNQCRRTEHSTSQLTFMESPRSGDVATTKKVD